MGPADADIGAVIFDCDGTLVDTEGLAFEAIVEQAALLGLQLAEDEETASFFRGRKMPAVLEFLQARLGAPLPADFEPVLRAGMAAKFRASLRAVDGAHEVLRQLRVPFCVATNGPRAKTELTLGLTGLLPFVEGRIFSAHELGCFKPDPGLFLAAAAALGVEARRCAVVEDSDPGIEAGLAAGMQVYALGSQADLRRAPGVRVLPALTNLLEAPWHRERGELPIQCADGAIFRG